MPSHSSVPQEIWMEDDDCMKKILEDIATHIISEHVDLATTFADPWSLYYGFQGCCERRRRRPHPFVVEIHDALL